MAGEGLQYLGRSLSGGGFLSTLNQLEQRQERQAQKKSYEESFNTLQSQFGENPDFKRIAQKYQVNVPGNVEGIASASEHMNTLQQLDQAFNDLTARYEVKGTGLTEGEQAEFLTARKNLDISRMNKYLDRYLSREDAILGAQQEAEKTTAKETVWTSESQEGINNFLRLAAGGKEAKLQATALGSQLLAPGSNFRPTHQFLKTYLELDPDGSADVASQSIVGFNRAIKAGDLKTARVMLDTFTVLASKDVELAKYSGTMEKKLTEHTTELEKIDVRSRIINIAAQKEMKDWGLEVAPEQVDSLISKLTSDNSDVLKRLKDLGYGTDEAVLAINKKAQELAKIHNQKMIIKLDNQKTHGAGADASGVLSGNVMEYKPGSDFSSAISSNATGFSEMAKGPDGTKFYVNESANQAVFVPKGSVTPKQVDLVDGKVVAGTERDVVFSGEGGLLENVINPVPKAMQLESSMAAVAKQYLGGFDYKGVKILPQLGSKLKKWGVTEEEFNRLKPAIANYNFWVNKYRPAYTKTIEGVYASHKIEERAHESFIVDEHARRYIEAATKLQWLLQSLEK